MGRACASCSECQRFGRSLRGTAASVAAYAGQCRASSAACSEGCIRRREERVRQGRKRCLWQRFNATFPFCKTSGGWSAMCWTAMLLTTHRQCLPFPAEQRNPRHWRTHYWNGRSAGKLPFSMQGLALRCRERVAGCAKVRWRFVTNETPVHAFESRPASSAAAQGL